MFMLRIRFDTFCTVPVIASSAPMRLAKRIAATAGLQVACLRLTCDRRDIDEREPAQFLSTSVSIAHTGKPLLFVSASAPDSAFQAGIDQFEIKDGNRLRNGGSAVYAEAAPQRHEV